MIAKSSADANSVYGDLVEETGADKKVSTVKKVEKKAATEIQTEKVSLPTTKAPTKVASSAPISDSADQA